MTARLARVDRRGSDRPDAVGRRTGAMDIPAFRVLVRVVVSSSYESQQAVRQETSQPRRNEGPQPGRAASTAA